MNTQEPLFSMFSPVTKDEWRAKAIEDLKGADFEKKLAWKTDEGFSVNPYYALEDMQGLENQYKNFASSKRTRKNYVEIKVDNDIQANNIALALKKSGANAFLFNFKHPQNHNFEILLKGLDATVDEISFSLAEPCITFFSDYLVYLNRSVIRAGKVNGFYECDVLENWSMTGLKPKFHELADLLVRSKPYPEFRCLVIRSHSFVNAGCNISQELAFTLHKLSDYIETLIAQGLKISDILNEVVLHFAIGSDYFFEIAKLRALRILLNDILEFYGCENYHMPVICSTANWSRSCYEPNVNMLRNTSEAMSAIAGGCDGLLIHAHDEHIKTPTDFSRRMALNIANILREESYFDAVSDPAAGSYYIENLTSQLVHNTLAIFKEIESKGGYILAFRNGAIQSKIAEQRKVKERKVKTGKKVYIGVNKHPDPSDKNINLKTQETFSAPDNLELLQEQTAVASIEAIRTRTMVHFKRTGYVPQVYMVGFGDDLMRKARSSFTTEFFAMAGFEMCGEDYFNDMQDAVTTASEKEADIIVLCSSDEDYAVSAVVFAKEFKKMHQHKTLVLAGYPEPIIEALKLAGIDVFIYRGCDAVEAIAALQNKLLV
jgi:methylmalonyl-CoA mutase